MPQRFDAVLFDLDGTLLNSLDDLHASINFALARHGFATRTLAEIRAFVGNGAALLAQRALAPEATPAQQTAVLADFRAHYADHSAERTQPYRGVLALLDSLGARGIARGVVSNKFDAAVGPLVAHFFGQRIEAAIGEGPGVPKKPDPAGARLLLERLDIAPERALLLGDSDVDIATAHNAGVFAVGCTWGFRDRPVLETAGADAIIDRPEQLLALLG